MLKLVNSNPTRVICLWFFFSRTRESTEYTVLAHIGVWVKPKWISALFVVTFNNTIVLRYSVLWSSFYFFAICNPLYFLCEKNTLYFSYIFQSVFNFLEGVFLVSQLLFFCAVFFSFFSLVLLYLFIHGSGVGNP